MQGSSSSEKIQSSRPQTEASSPSVRGGHDLIIDSLRDLQARCSCGAWKMYEPTFDRESDEEIKQSAEQGHEQHLVYVAYSNVKSGGNRPLPNHIRTRDTALREFIESNGLNTGTTFHGKRSSITALHSRTGKTIYILRFADGDGWDILAPVCDSNRTEQTILAAEHYLNS